MWSGMCSSDRIVSATRYTTASSPLRTRIAPAVMSSGTCNTSSSSATLSAELVEKGIRILQKRLLNRQCSPPTLFAVLQVVAAGIHKGIIARQEAAASVMLAVPNWGEQVSAIVFGEVKSRMRQQAPLTKVDALREACSAPGYEESLDSGVFPELLRAIASSSHAMFEDALRQVISGAEAQLSGQEEAAVVKLKVGPVKRANRIAVKVEEYREEKGDDSWPFSQFMTDILWASFIVGSAEEMVVVWEGLVASPDFEVVRLKNKIGQLNKPFNMHVNVLFKPVNCEDPILCEVQFCLQEVFDLMHRDHLLYEVVRAKGVGDLVS